MTQFPALRLGNLPAGPPPLPEPDRLLVAALTAAASRMLDETAELMIEASLRPALRPVPSGTLKLALKALKTRSSSDGTPTPTLSPRRPWRRP